MTEAKPLEKNTAAIEGFLSRDDPWEGRIDKEKIGQAISSTPAVIAQVKGQPSADEGIRDYLIAILRFAVRLRDHLDMDTLLPAPLAAEFAEHIAGAADDADQPTEAYSNALRLHPQDPGLLEGLVRWAADSGYAFEEALGRVAKADPANRDLWRARQCALDFHVAAGSEARDTALTWLAQNLGYKKLEVGVVRDQARALAEMGGRCWMAPTDEEWELVAELS